MSRPPSFEPWLARVKMARAALAVIGFVLVTALGYQGGIAPDDAALRGLAAAALCFLVGWAGSLWIASELYDMQIARLRRELQARELARELQVRELYEARMTAMGADAGATRTTPMQPPPMRDAA